MELRIGNKRHQSMNSMIKVPNEKRENYCENMNNMMAHKKLETCSSHNCQNHFLAIHHDLLKWYW